MIQNFQINNFFEETFEISKELVDNFIELSNDRNLYILLIYMQSKKVLIQGLFKEIYKIVLFLIYWRMSSIKECNDFVPNY